MQGDRERCLAAGMDGYVSKPVTLDELFSAIERAVPGFAREAPNRNPALTPSEAV